MCVKLSLKDLNFNFFFLPLTKTYIYEVTITPKMHDT